MLKPVRSIRPGMAPLVPVLASMAAGIVLDRAIESSGRGIETWGWALLGLNAAALAMRLLLRKGRLVTLAILAACACLGGGWHHHCRSDLPPEDIAWSIPDSPLPVWIRGTVREALGLRDANPPGPAEAPGPATTNPQNKAATNPQNKAATRFLVDVTAVRDGAAWKRASGRVLATVTGDRTDIPAGRAIDAAGTISRIEGPLNPGEFDVRDRLRREGIWLRLAIKDPAGIRSGDPRDDRLLLRWRGAVRSWSRDRLIGPLDPKVAPLASALVLGRREEVDDEINEDFVRTGTTHLLAISGLHLQAIAIALGAAFCLAGLSPKASAAGVALAVVGYAVLVGLAPSVVRSVAMTVTISLATIVFRQSRAANNLALAGLVTLAIDPSNLFDVGCQLSFLAIVALVWMIPEARLFLESNGRSILDRLEGPPSPLDALERQYEPAWKRRLRWALGWLYGALLTGAVIWLAALPLVALRFHLVSPIGVALNLILIPLTSAALLTAGVGLGLSAVWEPLGVPFGWATSQLLHATIWVVKRGSDISWGHSFVSAPPPWWVGGFYAILGVAVVSAVIVRDRGAETSKRWFARRRLIWLLLVLWLVPGLPLALASDRPARLEADILAVGHGLAVVIQTPSGASYLYDCGRMGDPGVGRRVVAPALWSRGISRLNSVILSHADDDHYNGLPDLFDRFRIGEVCVPPAFGGPENPGADQLLAAIRARGIPVRTVTAPDSWEVGGASFRVRHPPARWDRDDASDNARSIVLDVEFSGRRLLLTGDLEQLGLAEVVGRPVGEPPVDVMLSPHHGGKTANPEWLYEWANPGAIVVSQRAPILGSADLLSRREEEGIPVYRTWRDGAIRLSWNPSGIGIRKFLDEPGPFASPSIPLSPGRVVLASVIPLDLPNSPAIGPNGWRWLAGLAGFGFGLIGIGVGVLTEFVAWTLLVPPQTSGRADKTGDPSGSIPAGRPISAIASDGSRLSGRWFPTSIGQAPRGTVVLLHGFGETSARLAAERVPALIRDGWDVLVPDSRGYGQSAGPLATFGAREAGDVGVWIDVIRGLRSGPEGEPAHPLVAWGRSMGGAIAARAAAADPRISALILESPMLDLQAAVALIFRRRRLPFSSMLARRVLRRASRLAGISLGRPRLAEVAPSVACPALILHGTDDALASIDSIRGLARRFAKPAEVVEVDGAGHTNVIGVGGDVVWGRVFRFLNGIEPPEAPGLK